MADNVKIPLEDATDAQLRDHLTTFLQVELDDKVQTRAQLLAALATAGWTQPHIFVAEEPAMELASEQIVTPQAQARDLTARYEDDPVVELRIGKTGYPGGEHPASPIVNGRRLVIQRDVLVKIPYRYYLVLANAHEDQTRADPKGHPVTTRVTNFPLHDVKLPPQAEIDAWHERTKDAVAA